MIMEHDKTFKYRARFSTLNSWVGGGGRGVVRLFEETSLNPILIGFVPQVCLLLEKNSALRPSV